MTKKCLLFIVARSTSASRCRGSCNSTTWRCIKKSLTISLMTAVSLLTVAPIASSNLLTNGSFETPGVPAAGITYFGVGSAALTGWTVFGPSGANVAIVSGSFAQNGVSFPAQDGSQWLDLTGYSNSTEGVSQTVATIPGHRYQLSYYIGNTTGGTIFGATSTVDVLLNGVGAFVDTNATISPTTQNWEQFSHTFIASEPTTIIGFRNADPPNDNHNGLDNVVLIDQGPPARGDFNGDNKTDILWRDTTSGGIVVWLMNDTVPASSPYIGSVPTAWEIVGTADFNSDGKADILWRDTSSGLVVVWLMDGTVLADSAHIGTVPLTWEIVGTADFNSDGKTDILWRDTTSGGIVVWLMNDTIPASSAYISSVPLTWEIVGTADFNSDGNADILWRDTTSGGIVVWLMIGIVPASSAYISSVPTTWEIVGTADFNSDGKADILWRDTTSGGIVVWLMNDTVPASSAYIGWVPLNWEIVGP